MDGIRIQAKFLLVDAEQLLSPGQIVVRDGVVRVVTDDVSAAPDFNLGDALILPGLVNAHTHLEFSDLLRPFPAGDSFPSWIGAVVGHRRRQAAQHVGDALDRLRSNTLLKGLCEAYCTGTALLADIVTPPWREGDLPSIDTFISGARRLTDDRLKHFARPKIDSDDWAAHFRKVAFPRLIAMPELLGLTEQVLKASCDWANQLILNQVSSKHSSSEMLEGIGVSPHSPYSIAWPAFGEFSPDVSKTILRAMHVSESREELEWCSSGSGPFRNAFEHLGVPLESERMQFSDAIEILSAAQDALLIHGNYLTASEIDQIATRGNISVVYCPRTHAHFQHDAYPLEELKAARIRVLLGTDSRASNPDLSILREWRHVCQTNAIAKPQELLRSITTDASDALGCQERFGSLSVGNLAFANVLPLASNVTVSNLLEHIVGQERDPVPLPYWFCHSV